MDHLIEDYGDKFLLIKVFGAVTIFRIYFLWLWWWWKNAFWMEFLVYYRFSHLWSRVLGEAWTCSNIIHQFHRSCNKNSLNIQNTAIKCLICLINHTIIYQLNVLWDIMLYGKSCNTFPPIYSPIKLYWRNFMFAKFYYSNVPLLIFKQKQSREKLKSLLKCKCHAMWSDAWNINFKNSW